MRWFKHLAMAHTDGGVSAVLEELGAEAYGVWWLILEDIASPMDKNSKAPFAIHSEVKWSQICYCSARRFRSIAKRLEEKGLIVCTSTDNRLQIDAPKLLKYRDEYSKKSGQSPDSRTDTDTDGETDVDAEIKPLASSAEALPAATPIEPLALISFLPPEPPLGTIPLIDGSQFGFTQADVSGWCEAYPAVDVLQQLREFREWCKANPKLRKTRAGIRRAITSWLAKEQDKPTRGGFNDRTTATSRSLAAAGEYLETLRDREGIGGDEHPSPGRSLEGDVRRVC